MKLNLDTDDYRKILQYYNINKSKNIKKDAENILATKLCRCIKKVDKNESDSIAICRKSIFINRGFNFVKFKCKKGYKLLSNKTSKNKLYKKNRKIHIKTKKRRKKNIKKKRKYK